MTVVNEIEEIAKVVAPPTQNPSAQQIASWTQLFKDDPKDPKWQGVIKDLRTRYPNLLGDVNAYSNEEIDGFSSIGYKAFQSRNEQIYEKATAADVEAASKTTGLKVLAASKELKSFAVKTENAVTNLINLVTIVVLIII